MTTKDILELDYREEESKIKIQKVLKQIKPLSKYSEEIPIDVLEKCFVKLCSKYNIMIALGFGKVEDDYFLYGATIQYRDSRIKLGKVYGISVYEWLSKAIILIYSKTRGKT